jgi:YidC/Oxa1 family membrane protein insertase
MGIDSGEFKLDPGAAKTFDFTIYIGPQDLNLLRKLDGNISKIMAFSGHAFLDFIEKFIYNILLLMNKVIPNWGLCIILISLLIYGATYPLTLKSTLSMRKMQELQPKMAELREKYKNNPQKLNAEVVQLYKIHNVNPLSGCLPVLLQMPVFISLYQVLWRTHNFQGAKFLWIKDLSEPDRLVVLSSGLPFIGHEINILPVLMAIVMFFQQKISAKNMVVVDPAQEMQQKMMMFMMPVFIGGIFYHFASGLTLYFTIFYLLSTLTQYKMSKLNKVK